MFLKRESKWFAIVDRKTHSHPASSNRAVANGEFQRRAGGTLGPLSPLKSSYFGSTAYHKYERLVYPRIAEVTRLWLGYYEQE